MTHKEWERLGAAAGIIAIATLIVAFMLPGVLSSDASPTEIQSYFLDNRTALLAQTVLVGAAMLLFLLFMATLRNVLRRTEAGTGELSAVMSGAALVMVAMILVCMSIVAALTWRAAGTLDVSVTAFLYDLIAAGFTFIGVPTAVFLGTTAVLMRRTEVFPAWMSVGVAVMAVINAVAPLSLLFTEGAWGPLGLAAFLPPFAFMLGVLAPAVALVRHPEAGDARMPAAAMA
jgi:hypothetical protein